MAKSKCATKRKKKYTPKPVTLDPMRKALALKTVLTADEKSRVVGIARLALDAIREGRATKQDWSYLADAANVGEALSGLGIASDAESMDKLRDMQLALKTFADRANERGIWTATGLELKAMAEGLERHEIQLSFCSLDELARAVGRVKHRIAQARNGRFESITIIEPAKGWKGTVAA